MAPAADADDATAARYWDEGIRLYTAPKIKLQKIDQILNIPADVLAELSQIARICREGESDHPTFDMVARFFARSQLGEVAKRCWAAVSRSDPAKANLFPWATGKPDLSEPPSAQGADNTTPGLPSVAEEDEPIPSLNDLATVNGHAKQIAHYSAMLLNWANGIQHPSATYLNDPNFVVSCLLHPFQCLRVEPEAIDDLSPDGPQTFAGILGHSFHAVAWMIGQRILDAAADSFGGLVFRGINPSIGLTHVSITGLSQVDLRRTDFQDRLKAFEQFDPDVLGVFLDKEAAKTRIAWRRQEGSGEPPVTIAPAGDGGKSNQPTESTPTTGFLGGAALADCARRSS